MPLYVITLVDMTPQGQMKYEQFGAVVAADIEEAGDLTAAVAESRGIMAGNHLGPDGNPYPAFGFTPTEPIGVELNQFVANHIRRTWFDRLFQAAMSVLKQVKEGQPTDKHGMAFAENIALRKLHEVGQGCTEVYFGGKGHATRPNVKTEREDIVRDAERKVRGDPRLDAVDEDGG